jgi:2-polyprenyl-6-methoxyphenol hydroxylase-like FAD-dependent oxidoreductase
MRQLRIPTFDNSCVSLDLKAIHAAATPDTEVLIVGAGPTGLVFALALTRLGVRVRVIDKTKEPGTTSRALAVQARTFELYGQIGLADEVVEHGRRLPLHVFRWRRDMGQSGLRRDAFYLVRPDGYVAVVDRDGNAAALTSYFDAHQITPTG